MKLLHLALYNNIGSDRIKQHDHIIDCLKMPEHILKRPLKPHLQIFTGDARIVLVNVLVFLSIFLVI